MPHWNSIRLHLPKGSGGFRSPKTHPKTCVALEVDLIGAAAGYTKKGLNPNVRASSSLGFSPFFCPRCGRDCFAIGPAARLCSGEGTPFFLREKRAGRLRAGWGNARCDALHPNLLVSSQRNGDPNAQNTRAAVGRAKPCQRVKRAEKGPETEGRACSHIRVQTLFPYRLPRRKTQPPSNAAQVLCYFLDTRK